MPYFWNKKKDINILFVHIPKTGGTSVEQYFSKISEVPLNIESLYGFPWFLDVNVPRPFPNKVFPNSLQHMSYENLLRWSRKYFNIKLFNNTRIKFYTIVRNPYTRIMSDLFFWGFIDERATPEDVTVILKKYIACDYDTIGDKVNDYQPPFHRFHHLLFDNFDNHKTPQWQLVAKNEKELHAEMIYMRTETLTEDMINNGFTDFDYHELTNRIGTINYYEYLNDESIEIINHEYGPDFELFNYEKKVPYLKEIIPNLKE
tara:strand:+ start:925 stop:1704 length:780 start_codon:yes stop_codon:yes gene_type:complete